VEVPTVGTSILSVNNSKGALLVALILKQMETDEPDDDPPFDADPWWTTLSDVRIVAQVTAGEYSGGQSSFNSTGEYVGGLLQGVFGEKDHLVFTTRIQTVPRTPFIGDIATHAYRWSEFAPKESGKRISDGDLQLVEVPVSDTDRAVMKTIMNSPAMKVPLKPGARPVEFRPDNRGRMMAATA
jgi:hypothetical protein